MSAKVALISSIFLFVLVGCGSSAEEDIPTVKGGPAPAAGQPGPKLMKPGSSRGSTDFTP